MMRVADEGRKRVMGSPTAKIANRAITTVLCHQQHCLLYYSLTLPGTISTLQALASRALVTTPPDKNKMCSINSFLLNEKKPRRISLVTRAALIWQACVRVGDTDGNSISV